ncbi:hypothetical protein [Nocardia sp. NBC_00511]
MATAVHGGEHVGLLSGFDMVPQPKRLDRCWSSTYWVNSPSRDAKS